jgi:hypothetical protein
MSYIGEILWALGNKRDAVVWAEGSYYEAWTRLPETSSGKTSGSQMRRSKEDTKDIL